MYKSNNLQSRKMSYSSSYFSSYDDDSNVKLFSIPRTQHIDFDSEHEEENYESFPLNMFLNENSKIYNNFINRKDEKISPLFSSIETPDKELEIPEIFQTLNSERVVIYMLELTNLLSEKQNSFNYIHSWCDITKVSSVEAKRAVTKFFSEQYMNLEHKPWPNKPVISWAKSFNEKIFTNSSKTSNNFIKIFHYVGLGFPPPEKDKIWMKGTDNTSESYVELNDLRYIIKSPCMMIFDCDNAAILKDSIQNISQLQDSSFFTQNSPVSTPFALFSCSQNEQINIASTLPQNFFTCILLSPDKAYSSITNLNLNSNTQNIFESLLDVFTETIAVDTLPTELFYRLFRTNDVVSSIWRRFLLAQKLMKYFGLHVKSIPDIPDMSEHHLWEQFDYFVMSIGPIYQISHLYILYNKQFTSFSSPPKYVTAFMTNLLYFPEFKKIALSTIANFMRKSMRNCRKIAKVLNLKYICKSELFLGQTDWCTVVSGILLVSPSSTRILSSSISIQDLLKASLSDKYEEEYRIYLLSIYVSFKFIFASHFNYLGNSDQEIDKLIRKLFDSPPRIREWLSFLLFSGIPKYNFQLGKKNLHVYSMLLLYDKIKFTRTMAIIILTSLMSVGWQNFNENLMRCALKGAIDGSNIVRLAFLYCVARYCNLNNELCDEVENESLEEILRADPLKFSAEHQKPKLRQLVTLLKADPNQEVRETASHLLNDPQNSGYELSHEHFSFTIYRLAHKSLFCSSQKKYEIKQRYPDNFIMNNTFEMFETINYKTSSITAISFDLNHENVCFGNEKGHILLNQNKWKISSAVISLIHLANNILVAANEDGSIYIFKDGGMAELESFRPSISFPNSKTIICSIPKSYIIFISQGYNSIYVWDIESLLLIHCIQIPYESSPVCMYYFNDCLYVALQNGIILCIKNYEIVRTSTFHQNQVILRIGEYNHKLYSITSQGIIYIWDDLENQTQFGKEIGPVTDILLHPIIPYAIKVDSTVSFINLLNNEVYELDAKSTNCTCVAFDGERKLAAIGFDNGSVSIWKFPVE